MTWPAIFFLRRTVFVYSVIYLTEFLWGQIAVQLLSTILMIIYLLEFRPLETPFANRMEIMNEVTTLLLTYGLMCFTKFLPDPEMRNNGGFLYIGVLAGNILVHLTFMVGSTCYLFKMKYKRRQTRPTPKSQMKKANLDLSGSSSENSSSSHGSEHVSQNVEESLKVVNEANSQEEADSPRSSSSSSFSSLSSDGIEPIN